MQRHGKHVPPSFYHTFARDAVQFAETHAQGKLISVLEGGYSDRALCSAALAHVSGLAVGANTTAEEGEAEWWKLDNLIAVEKVAKKMAAHAAGAGSAGGMNTTPKRRQAELAPWLATTSRAFAAFEQACGKKDVVPLGMPGAVGSGRSSNLASAVNSPATIGSMGRVLRDRKSRPAFEVSTPQASANRRGASSPTKATPTRVKKESPNKKESPSKARVSGGTGALFAPATPVKNEPQADDSMSMDTDTPTRSTAVASGSTILPTQPIAIQSTSTLPQPTAPHEQQSQLPPAQPASVFQAQTITHATQQPPAAPSAETKPHPIIGSGSWLPPSTTARSPFPSSSNPTSPTLTATPVTLVDAMSSSHHRIVDHNTQHRIVDHNTHHRIVDHNTHHESSDPLGLDYLREQAFHFANGDGEEDAEGSPDPEMMQRQQSEEYFPIQKVEEHRMPGGIDGLGKSWTALDLEHATLVKLGSSPGRQIQLPEQRRGVTAQHKEDGSGSLYPTLPPSHGHQHS